jgi:chromosome segregation ATPase
MNLEDGVNVGELLAIVTGAGGLLGTIAALIYIRPQLRKLTAEGSKTRADEAAVLTTTSLSLLRPVEEKAAKLEAQLERAEAKIAELGLSLYTANARADGLASKLSGAERTIQSLTDRLQLAQRLLTEHGVPFPPVEG